MRHKVNVEVGGANIFADLGLPDADTHFLKAQIVSETGSPKVDPGESRKTHGH